jgi:soluble lytic murein transglycosylase-like protein
MSRAAGTDGQALVALLGGLLLVLAGAVALGLLGAGLEARDARQRAADLAALAGARALLDAQPRALALPDDPRALPAARYRALAAEVARRTAVRNGATRVSVALAPGQLPDGVTVTVSDPIRLPGGLLAGGRALAEARMALAPAPAGDGEYPGPFALRQGKPMRPDVALAFDRLAAAARAAGHGLVVVSAFRSNAEQARLFAAHPDPRWVAPPGRSLHRLGTELDLGPASAYTWLAAHARRFGFLKRYAWEPWHFGYVGSPGSRSVGFGPPAGAGAVPGFVPARYAPALRGAASRFGVGAALLAAQLQQESGFNARAVSPAGALGIAQFMPATARAYGLRDPFDADAAIHAQARLMAELLRRFGSVPLALAAYNAGPGRVAACGCVPPIAETQAYVRRVVALAAGVGGLGAGGPPVRLVR